MMDNAQLAGASLNDIVFETRNKAYGAYVLRRIYSKNVTRALLIAIALFALGVSAPLIARMLAPEEEAVVEKPKNLKVNELMQAPPLDASTPPPPPPPPPPPAAAPPPPPKVATVRFVPPVVKRDNEVRKEEKVPDQDELKDKAISTETKAGTPNTAPTGPVDLNGLEGGTGKEIVETVVDNKPYTFVEQMPEFPGGQGALLKYIGNNMRYPAMALRNQVEGKVFIKFVVGPDGQVSNVEVQKGIGSGCDEEAVRVVKSLPKFIPGKQNGRAVSVYYTLPITFAIK